MFKGFRVDNVYTMNLVDVSTSSTKYLVKWSQDSRLWHRHWGYTHFELFNKITSKNPVNSLPKIHFLKEKLCEHQNEKANKSVF